MIEITIPYWIGAGIICVLMIACIVFAILCVYLRQLNFASLFIFLLIVIDLFAAGASSGYMSTPTESPCCEFCNSNWNYMPHCEYPTVNPYEQQPIHPIMWTLKISQSMWGILTGTIHIKNEVI